MSNKFRLSSGGEINRNEKISFKFNGKNLFGYKGRYFGISFAC